MASRLADALSKRQAGQDDPYDDGDDYYGGPSWWWTPTGMAVRYTIVLLLFAAAVTYFIGGYYHARRRIAKGLAPLPYHRWMARRFYRQQQLLGRHPGQAASTTAGAGAAPAPEAYDLPSYAPPPPAYNHHEAPPPVYQPPEGASKAMADQNFQNHGQTYRAGENSASSARASERP